jgi:hypothetical protein
MWFIAAADDSTDHNESLPERKQKVYFPARQIIEVPGTPHGT